jgi:hypothetical protein
MANMWRKILVALLLGAAAWGQDIFTQVYSPFAAVRNIPWGNGAGAMNNTFWFNSIAPELGTCVIVYNNNPTSAHSFTLVVQQSSDPNTSGFTGFSKLWTAVAGSTTFPFSLAANTSLSMFYATRSSSFIALTFSGTATQAGNPDTANIIIVEADVVSCANSGASNSVQGIIPDGGSSPNVSPVLIGGWKNTAGTITNVSQTVAVDSATRGMSVGRQSSLVATSTDNTNAASLVAWDPGFAPGSGTMAPLVVPFGGADDTSSPGVTTRFKTTKDFGLMTSNAWQWESGNPTARHAMHAQTDSVNPAGGFDLLSVNQAGASSGLFLNRIVISCSVACDILINRTSAQGNTCTAVTARKAFNESLATTSANAVQTNCTLGNPPVINQSFHLWLAANTVQIMDMTGYWMGAGGGTNGFSVVNNTAIAAGTVSVTIEWDERAP